MFLLLACAPTDGSFEVLTYNVHGLPSAITGDDTPARLQAIAPRLEDFDLVGLQEDFVEENHEHLVTSHPTQTWFGEPLNDRAFGSGLNTLAHAELVDLYEENFDACHGLTDNGGDCGASKGFQILRLAVEGVQIDVLNTHLEAGGSQDDTEARQVSIDQIEAALDDFSADRPVLFLGDFNLKWGDPEDVPLLEQIEAMGPFVEACEPDCDPDEIDRIYLRSTDDVTLTAFDYAVETWTDADGVDLSDHDPVRATVSWSH